MSRLDIITIGIVVVCLALLGFLVYKIVDLMKAPEDSAAISISDTYDADSDANADDTYNYDEEVNEANANEGDLDDDEVAYTSEDEYDMGDAGVDDDENTATETATAATTSTTAAVRNYSSTSTAGQYLVIAGSYRERVNADNQVARLKNMGYNSAEVRMFDRGSYALVLVNRFDSKSEADALSQELKGKGVDVFVQKKR